MVSRITQIILFLTSLEKYNNIDEGNILCEDDFEFYSFHFEIGLKDGLPVRYQGAFNKGINFDVRLK